MTPVAPGYGAQDVAGSASGRGGAPRTVRGERHRLMVARRQLH